MYARIRFFKNTSLISLQQVFTVASATSCVNIWMLLKRGTGSGERGTGNGSLGTSCQRKPLSQRFGHPHSHIPSVLGIPFSYYCSVLGIPRYPSGMPKSLAFWASPPKQFGISRENRKPFRDGFR